MSDAVGPLDDERREHEVVVNPEGQYSVWATDRPRPAGWEPVGVRGSRSECLLHIAHAWTDMRPRSLRASAE